MAIFDGMQVSTDYAMTLPFGSFSGIDSGETVIIAAVSYRVREVMALDDGAVKRVTLGKI